MMFLSRNLSGFRNQSQSRSGMLVTTPYSEPLHFDGEGDIVEVESRSGPVAYDSEDWFQVLFQCFGSVWPKVLKFCLGNVAIMIAVTMLKADSIIDLGVTSQVHGFAKMIVGFLLVSRVNTALKRYQKGRNNVNILLKETRRLIHSMIVMSISKNNNDKRSREWRNEVAYRAMILLRTSVAVLEYLSKGIPGWKCPELSGFEATYATPCELWKRNSLRADPGDMYSNTMRIPSRMAFLLQKSVAEQDERLACPLNVRLELKLLRNIDHIMYGVYGIRTFITTPVPFPKVQIGRTIILLYIATMPLILLNIKETGNYTLVWDCISTFLLTYGFMGLELVAIELDDPFGSDENDFDTLSFAYLVFEDTIMLIEEVDGEEWAELLRKKMGFRKKKISNTPTNQNGNSFTRAFPNEKTKLLSSISHHSPKK